MRLDIESETSLKSNYYCINLFMRFLTFNICKMSENGDFFKHTLPRTCCNVFCCDYSFVFLFLDTKFLVFLDAKFNVLGENAEVKLYHWYLHCIVLA